LSQLIRIGPLEEKLVIQICCRISQAIDELWNLRIVHRDIKPGNILVGELNTVYLIDLGVAKHLDKETVTTEGYTLGTPGYMSPEQAIGRKGLTLKSDMFSLGIVLYEALTGLHPFNNNQYLIGRINPRRLGDIKKVRPELIEVIENMLALHPTERPSSGISIRNRLCPFTDNLIK